MNEQALKDRLQAIAKERGIHFNECWKKLLLERFLARLARSKHTRKFVFKGGFLLAYMIEIGRETTDLDFLLTHMHAEEEEIREAIQEILATISDDGFSFSYKDLALLEQPHMEYPGYRVSLKAEFGRMKDHIHIDVGIGDIVQPTSREFSLFEYRGKPLFEREISLLVYPLETIFAEKLETVISKGAINSRMKDYHDLYLLIRQSHVIQPLALGASLKSTFEHRETKLELIDFDEVGLESLKKLWAAHLKNLGKISRDLKLPHDIQEIIQEINSYLMKQELIPLAE
ncbi:nucleotidyl transferase AbiEii/AbiGii toxin family protein [Parachlamydia sp. AcF125]|uniref:nucleotidyl transferase AbiEii/AbiGii toxin family protein n=1 Tax=Parachlamydia sp. AcF125 TaxID=2795736 RepID=UPI001BC93CDC|nr:nucleotidyl transferase AbiEii/AbiGii toxin family protein [Parachlamydia sp. AcF125]MBS4168485.1 hypothetical protein [Parachlamydia sp. AcF125]